MARLRAAAALPLSGRYAGPAADAAAGLHAWAEAAGARVRIVDAGEDPEAAGRLTLALAPASDLLFGPYGSGATRAAARALRGEPWVLWNHGGAALEPTGARVASVLGPAERYWSGLADVLAEAGVDRTRVAVLHAASGFGRATAEGAAAALRHAGAEPLLVAGIDERTAGEAAGRALAAGASCVVGCGRIEDDLALGRALLGAPVAVGLVVCGVAAAAEALGDGVAGWIGPAQWWPGGPAPPVPLPAGADYPAAQALAAGLVAEAALRAAGSADPDALWAAALALRTRTFLGPFALDAEGRQVAHAPCLVRWERERGRLVRRLAWAPGGVSRNHG
jgi:ABC-type branched-subunit amino acid transport system substrate-binding protein